MRAFEFLLEKVATEQPPPADNVTPGDPKSDPLYSLKLAVANKIKDLPFDDDTKKALDEVEDILDSVKPFKQGGRRGRFGTIDAALDDIAMDDSEVAAAKKMLAKYVLSIDMTKEERADLFGLWKSGKLVNVEQLLKVGHHTFADVITGYDKPYIRELVSDLSTVESLGVGKGEFLFAVLSPRITKSTAKGDLVVDGEKSIEVKTYDKSGGRFYDREVKPSSGYLSAVNTFLNKYRDTITQMFGKKIPKTGLNLMSVMDIRMGLKQNPETAKLGAEIDTDIDNLLGMIFPEMDTSKISQAIKANNLNLAKQEYAKTNFDYYTKIKQDFGTLSINLTTKPPSMTFFKTADDLVRLGMRFHADTIFLVSTNEQEAYPKIRITPTKG